MHNDESRAGLEKALLSLEHAYGTLGEAESRQRAQIIEDDTTGQGLIDKLEQETYQSLDLYKKSVLSSRSADADTLRVLVQLRYDIMDNTVAMAEAGDQAAFKASFAGGMEVMAKIKQLVMELKASHYSMLEREHAESKRLTFIAHLVIIISFILAFTIAAAAFIRTARVLKKKQEAENKLWSSEHFRNKITDIVPGLIAVYNLNTGQYLYVNDAIHHLLGYTKQEVLEKGISFFVSIIHPEDLPDLMEKNRAALELAHTDPAWNDMRSVNFEYRIRHRNGQWRWFLTSGLIFKRDANGKAEELINLSFDITENKLYEEKLLKSEELLQEAQNMANLGSWEWNIERNTVTWTDELYRMYGYEPGGVKVSYETFLSHIHPDDHVMVKGMIERSYQTHEPFSFEHKVVQPGGKVRTLLGKGRVITKEGKPVLMRGSTLDITDIRKTLEELRLKDEFIGIASHELKTPLTSIKAYAQLLEQSLQPEGDEVKLTYIRKTATHIDRLNSLISDLLDVSKIQAGKLQLNISEFSIDELVKESIESIQHTSSTHTIIAEGAANDLIMGDRLRLEQAFVNFLTNAIKYSPKADKVLVKIGTEPGNVKISVTDYGIGIPKEKVAKIFDRFYRVDDMPHRFTGLGIGLYIASEIIQRHNGRIWVDTKEGMGSTFHFTLPVSQPV